MAKNKLYKTEEHARTLIVGIDAPYNKTPNIESYFDEFENLVRSNGVEYVDFIIIKLRSIDNAYFLTKGKLQELKQYCDTHNIEHVIFSDPLTTQQERNLTDYLHCSIFDRTQLILEIFEKHAHTAEGKAQVAIALWQHKKTRLAGKGVGMAQQKGSIGVRGGFGETAKEKETRSIEERILQQKRVLERLEKSRATQRKRRLDTRIPQICLIGYTNAGKSTILNALTKGNVLAEDKLFATLDTTTKELYIDGQKKGVLSDTVGFIQQLPHRLIEAFKSTLSELQYADLLLHVVDLSDPNWENQIAVVHEILEELNVDKKMLYVFNKIDKVENISALSKQLARYQPRVLISAQSKEGLEPLIAFLSVWNKQ